MGALGVFLFVAVFAIAGATGRIAAWSEHWRMALIMTLGSLVGGGTPFGDGSVSFPFMTLLYDESYEVSTSGSVDDLALFLVGASYIGKFSELKRCLGSVLKDRCL